MPFQYPHRIPERKLYNIVLGVVYTDEWWIANHASFRVTGNLAAARQNVRSGVSDALAGLNLHDLRFDSESRPEEASGFIDDAAIQLGLNRLALPANRSLIHGINDSYDSGWTDSDAGKHGAVDMMLQLAIWGSIVRHPVNGPF